VDPRRGRGRPALSTPATSARVKREILVASGAGIYVAALIFAIARLHLTIIGDYQTYWVGARHVIEHAPIYAVWQLHGPFPIGFAAFGRGYVYPPTAALISIPLGVISLDWSWMVATTGLAIALAVVSFRIARREGLSHRASRWAAILVVASGPSVEALATGNANVLIAIGLGVLWVKPGWAGHLAVVGGLIKVYPALGLAWAVRKRSALRWPLAVAMLLVVVSILVLGIQPWIDFYRVIRDGQATSDFALEAPRAALESLIGPIASALVTYAVAGLLTLFVARGQNDHRDFFVLSVAMILPAPDWYLHYLVVPVVGLLPIIIRYVVLAQPAWRWQERPVGHELAR
jgi:hypothetical protein